MEPRLFGVWAVPVLIILGNVFLSVLAGFNDSNAIVQSLDCTTDFIDRIFCDIKAPNCTEYKLHFQEINKWMICKQEGQSCRCLPEQEIMLIYGDTHSVSVRKEDEDLSTKVISINQIIVPRVPTIVSVKNSNGNFEILWTSNMETNIIDQYLRANVTYFEKGKGAKKTSTFVTPTVLHKQKFYSIPGKDLESSTTYVVCVRSYSNWSRRFSDCSAEEEFTTPFSQTVLTVIIILILSVVVIVVTSVSFVYFVKLKDLWMVTMGNYPKPKILLLNQTEERVLKLVQPDLSEVHIEPLEPVDKLWLLESVITAGDHPSSFSGGIPVSPLLSDSGLSSSNAVAGSCSFDNRSYFIVLPSLPQQEERSDVTPQGSVTSDLAYQAAGADSGQRLLEHLLLASAALPPAETDTGYQVQKADPAQLPPAGGSSPTSSRGGELSHRLSGPGAGCEDVDQQLFFRGGSRGPGPVDFSYQSFQSLVEPAEKLGAEEPPGRAFTATSEASSLPAASCGADDDPASLTQTSFMSLLSADRSAPIVMESGYHSVEPSCVW